MFSIVRMYTSNLESILLFHFIQLFTSDCRAEVVRCTRTCRQRAEHLYLIYIPVYSNCFNATLRTSEYVKFLKIINYLSRCAELKRLCVKIDRKKRGSVQIYQENECLEMNAMCTLYIYTYVA